MATKIVVEGLAELRKKCSAFPRKFSDALNATLWASLDTLWENVPSYPPQQPDSSYVRTGLLGRSLGSSVTGGRTGGRPDIYEVHKAGQSMSGSFGTHTEYASHAIGDAQREQRKLFANRGWWTLPQTVVNRSVKKIERLFIALADGMAAWLDDSTKTSD